MDMDDESKITRIFLLRSSNVTTIMIASLKWASEPILKHERIQAGGRWFYDAYYLSGDRLLIIEDYLEKPNLKIEQLINCLNKFDILVVGYPNDLLLSKLTAGYEQISVDFEKPVEYREMEKQEIRDITNNLFSTKKLINQSKMDISSPLGRDCLAIAVKTWKRVLVSNIHDYYVPPNMTRSRSSTYSEMMNSYYHKQIQKIILEPSQYTIKGRRK